MSNIMDHGFYADCLTMAKSRGLVLHAFDVVFFRLSLYPMSPREYCQSFKCIIAISLEQSSPYISLDAIS